MSPVSTTPRFRTLSTMSRREASSVPRMSSVSVGVLATLFDATLWCAGCDEIVRRPRPGEGNDHIGQSDLLHAPAHGRAERFRPGYGHEEGSVEQQAGAGGGLFGRGTAPRVRRFPAQRGEEPV